MADLTYGYRQVFSFDDSAFFIVLPEFFRQNTSGNCAIGALNVA